MGLVTKVVPSLLALTLLQAFKPSEAHELLNHKVVNDKFEFWWQFMDADSSVVFELKCRTQGWCGLGLSPKGDMEGADLFIGWVRNGVGYLKDAHAKTNGPPTVDAQNDLTLINATESGTHTILRFKRPLSTGDEFDMPISKDTFKLIYASSNQDPLNTEFTTFPYNLMHEKTDRGTVKINFAGIKPDIPLPANHFPINMQMPNVTIPNVDTTY